MVVKIILCVLLTLGLCYGGYAALQAYIGSEVGRREAERANKTTNDTLTSYKHDMDKLIEGTGRLHDGMAELTNSTNTNFSNFSRDLANAKTVNLADRVSPAIAESLCVQYHKANSGNAVHRKTVPGALLQLPADAFAKRCRTAWARVTWGAVIEWIFPLMEHDGGLQRMLDAGAEYYAPQEKN